MSLNPRPANSTRPMGPSGDIEPAVARTSWRNFYIDCAALFLTGVLITGLIFPHVYVWRRRCRGRDCEICLAEQEDDIFEDVDFVYDEKDAVGKKD